MTEYQPKPQSSGYGNGGENPPNRPTAVGLGGDDNPDPSKYISLDDALNFLIERGYDDEQDELLFKITSGLIEGLSRTRSDYWVKKEDLETYYP